MGMNAFASLGGLAKSVKQKLMTAMELYVQEMENVWMTREDLGNIQ